MADHDRKTPVVFLEMNILADWGWGINSNLVSSLQELSNQTVIEIAENKIGFFTNLPWRAGIISTTTLI